MDMEEKNLKVDKIDEQDLDKAAGGRRKLVGIKEWVARCNTCGACYGKDTDHPVRHLNGRPCVKEGCTGTVEVHLEITWVIQE